MSATAATSSQAAPDRDAIADRWCALLLQRERRLHEFYYAVLLCRRPVAAAIFFPLWFYIVHVWIERVMSSAVWMAATALLADAVMHCVSHANDPHADATADSRYRLLQVMAERASYLLLSALHRLIHVDDQVLYAPDSAAMLPSVMDWAERLARWEMQARQMVSAAQLLRAQQPVMYLMWAAVVYAVSGIVGWLLPNTVLLFIGGMAPVLLPFALHHYARHMELLAGQQRDSLKCDATADGDASIPPWWRAALTERAVQWWQSYQQATVLPDSFHPATPESTRSALRASTSSFAILSPSYWSSGGGQQSPTRPQSAIVTAAPVADELLPVPTGPNGGTLLRRRHTTSGQQLNTTDLSSLALSAAVAVTNNPPSWLSHMARSLLGPPAGSVADPGKDRKDAASDDELSSVEDGFTYVASQSPPPHE